MRIEKRDNSNTKEKIDIRAWGLREAGFDELRVLDLCAGEGHIWRALRERFRVNEYAPVDKEPRFPGTIRGEVSAELLASIQSERFNVVDIDTYGRPWAILADVLPRITGRTVLMLTCGRAALGQSRLATIELDALGIPLDWPYTSNASLGRYAETACLWKLLRRFDVLGGMRTQLPTVAYYALVVEPKREEASDGIQDGDRVD